MILAFIIFLIAAIVLGCFIMLLQAKTDEERKEEDEDQIAYLKNTLRKKEKEDDRTF